MARPKLDPEILAHLEWLGFVRPTGLVVSAPALVRAGAILDRRDAEGQRLLRACLGSGGGSEPDRIRERGARYGTATMEGEPSLPDFRAFAESVLGWSFSPKAYAGTTESPIPPELEVPLPDYGETLRPDFAVRELEPKEGASAWQLLVRVVKPGEDLDRVVRADVAAGDRRIRDRIRSVHRRGGQSRQRHWREHVVDGQRHGHVAHRAELAGVDPGDADGGPDGWQRDPPPGGVGGRAGPECNGVGGDDWRDRVGGR
jgi:hypothetical protein